MVAAIVLAVVGALLVTSITVFYFHSRTPEWGDSSTRKALLEMLIVIGPFFGVRYRPPRTEIPVVTTPGLEPEQEPLYAKDGSRLDRPAGQDVVSETERRGSPTG